MDINKQITTLRGESIPMSNPNRADLEAIQEKAKAENRAAKLEDLPRETLGNVLIGMLAHYVVKDQKEVFLVQAIAGWVIGDAATDFPEKAKDFLIKSLIPFSTIREEKNDEGKLETKGVYAAWVVSQVYQAFGVTE